ncbi:MAG: DUF547 domain-containing protein [Methylotenera sp.]|nr:DUF547 domain-containing protein [Oligoflexia bacterium]
MIKTMTSRTHFQSAFPEKPSAIFLALLFGFTLLVEPGARAEGGKTTTPAAKLNKNLKKVVTPAQPVNQGFDHSHAAFKALLEKNSTTQGSHTIVKYTELKANPAALNAYLKTLEDLKKEDFDRFTLDQKLTFWINAYNAFTIKLIVDHLPLKSIKDIGKPWKMEFFTLLGTQRSLDQVEHDIIRKDFQEPRVHLALVCASKGCPALKGYAAEQLEQQLESVTRVFLQDPERNRHDAAKKTIRIGKIFDWYGDDFKRKFGSVQNFVAPRMGKTPAEIAEIASKDTDVEYNDYDWSLNGI